MKQIVILSGKGGTGKTFVSASLACIAEESVIADCDVDAANLHLLLHPERTGTYEFSGGKIAEVNADRCTGCGLCVDSCRFDALSMVSVGQPGNAEAAGAAGSAGAAEKAGIAGKIAAVDPVACEGCGVCGLVCPEGAFSFRTSDAGRWYTAETKFGPMVHAHLFAGEENSGKLVQEVRNKARSLGEELDKKYVLIDGPPGTGCAVMSAMTGVDLIVLTTEPTVAGIHDAKRVVQLAGHFSIPVGMIVNKSTINLEKTAELKEFAGAQKIRYFGEIPYDRRVVDSVADLHPYACIHEDEITRRLRTIWAGITELVSS
jgi:MinD superfamily P-loop ATPase